MRDKTEQTHGDCIGFVQETENGGVYELGNGWIHRRIMRLGDTVVTSSLVNVVNGEEYLEESNSEFVIQLLGDYDEAVLSSSDFRFRSVSTPVWTEAKKQLKFELEAEVLGETLEAALVYESRAQDNLGRKWLEIGPLTGWQIGSVTLEDLKFVDDVQAVRPTGSEEAGRFVYGDYSDSVMEFWGCTEGMFALGTQSNCTVRFGQEKVLRVMEQMDVSTDSNRLSATAIIGAYRGLTEYGFYAYRRARLAECRPQIVTLRAPEKGVGTESAVSVRRDIYEYAWQTPMQWIDPSALRGWLAEADKLSKVEYLHVLLSMLGLLKSAEMELLAERAACQESTEAARSAVGFLNRFAQYFADYRHVLGKPDGHSVEGHGHFVEESGFIVLINPTDDTITVELPLGEPGIWLSLQKKHQLTDWSSLNVGVPMGESKPHPSPQITLNPHEQRIIGVNVS